MAAIINGGSVGAEMTVDAVRYAKPDGDNANDGLTWDSAKKDVVSAYDALPAAGGTIYMATGTYADSVNTDRGLWLLNAQDPGYNGGSPAGGWRVGKPIHLIGVGGGAHVSNGWARSPQMLGGSATDRLKPALWIAGGIGPTVFENILFPTNAVTVRLGVTSTMTGGVSGTINTATVSFKDCNFESTAFFDTGGPTIEIGYLFWCRWENCGFMRGNITTTNLSSIVLQSGTTYRFTVAVNHRLKVGDKFQIEGVSPAGYNSVWTVSNVASATAVDAVIGSNPGASSGGTMRHGWSYYRAAIGHDVNDVFPGGTNSGLWEIVNCNFNGGAVHYSPGVGTSSGNVFMRNITLEGGFTTADPPVFHLKRPGGPGRGALFALYGIQLENLGVADSLTPVGVVNDYLDQRHDSIIGINVGLTSGPMTTFGSGVQNQDVAGVANVESRFNKTGFNNYEFLGTGMDSRRAFSPTSARFANFVSQNPSDWGGGSGDLVVTTGKKAPNGTTNAAEFANTAPGVGAQHKILGSGSSDDISVGAWFVAGAWRRYISGEDNVAYEMKSDSGVTLRNSDNNIKLNQPNTYGDTGWEWVFAFDQVTVASSPSAPYFQVRVNSNGATGKHEVFAPLAFVIPASEGLSEIEVQMIAQHMQSWTDGFPAGSATLMHGQSLGFVETTDPTAPSTNRALLYAKDNGSGKTQLVVRFPTGAVQVLATEP
jgi:hypothetical protein